MTETVDAGGIEKVRKTSPTVLRKPNQFCLKTVRYNPTSPSHTVKCNQTSTKNTVKYLVFQVDKSYKFQK